MTKLPRVTKYPRFTVICCGWFGKVLVTSLFSNNASTYLYLNIGFLQDICDAYCIDVRQVMRMSNRCFPFIYSIALTIRETLEV